MNTANPYYSCVLHYQPRGTEAQAGQAGLCGGGCTVAGRRTARVSEVKVEQAPHRALTYLVKLHRGILTRMDSLMMCVRVCLCVCVCVLCQNDLFYFISSYTRAYPVLLTRPLPCFIIFVG